MRTILCIEDEPDIRESICEELVDAGFKVIEAANGQEGLEAIQKHKLDLVLCDINMPVMDGSALLECLRENFPELAEVPFVFLSANADRNFVIAGKELGADDYLTKPIDFDLLIATINARLGQVSRIQEKHQRQMVQTQKMEAIGRLTSGVSHEFNNLLTAIRGFSEIASRNLDKKDLVKECLDDVIDAADRAAAITRQLLAFSRKHYCDKITTNANEIVTDLQRLLKSTVGPKFDLNFSLMNEPAFCNVDPKLFSQVIINLVINARDAMSGGGTIEIETKVLEIDETETLELPEEMTPGRYVSFSITDFGTGMEEGMINEIFEPFFTTKDESQGTGLGLSVAYGIVRQSQGIIDCESVLGQGSTFRVLVPQVDAEHSEKAQALREQMAVTTPGERGTILVVDDEKSMLHLVKVVLENAGYRVFTADGEEGLLKAFKDHPKEIDLVLCDIVLPEIDGPELVEKLKGAIDGARIVFMTGDITYQEEKYLKIKEMNDFLEKPFTPNELETTVSRSLCN
jgi:signal transduction histidine kinase